MSSNTALTGGGGGGGVAWQVDLPGLASLVLNLGAAGLKRFAEAGVDFHTILCMGEIAEKCPASNEYRKELSMCREAQRKQSQWLYKLVEIGAATNFVADELLKKRAGENIVALMSAVLPVMSESACDNLLLKLFEACKAPLDKTPGFGQLKSIRESLTPLARKTQFKDKAFQYHVLSRQLIDADASGVSTSAYDSIPSEETAVQVILALSRLVQEDRRLTLAYHGLKGSGWVIAYARHVLGLSVCVLSSDSQTVPISGDYHSARVLVYIHEDQNKCEILRQRNVQEIFVTQSLDPASRAGWQIDVGKTNVLDYYVSRDGALRKAVSVIALTMMESYIEVLAAYFSEHGTDKFIYRRMAKAGLLGYPTYCLPALRKRARRILLLFGFEPLERPALLTEVWSDYIKIPQNCLLNDGSPHLVAGPAWLKAGLGFLDRSDNRQGEVGSPDASDVRRNVLIDRKGIAQISFVLKAVEAACWLAFTNWDQHLQLLSTSFLENAKAGSNTVFPREFLIHALKYGQPGNNIQRIDFSFYSVDYRSFMTHLVNVVMDISIGGRQTWTSSFEDDRMLAFHHRGLIFIHNPALSQTLDLQSNFLHLLQGVILANGERQNKVYSYPSSRMELDERGPLDDSRQRRLMPVNLFPNISISTHLEVSSVDIILRQTALVNDRIFPIAEPGIISKALARLLVTTGCNHHYYTSFDSRKLASSMRIHTVINQGLHSKDSPSFSRNSKIWLQTVDQNAPGQWLAYQQSQFSSHFSCLQRECCIGCTFRMIKEVSEQHDGLVWSIIYGRLEGENME